MPARIVVLVALAACGASAPVAAPIPSAPPPAVVEQPSSANPPPFDPAASSLIIQVSGPAPTDAIPQFDVDVRVDGASILSSLTISRTPGIVYVSGLRHATSYEIAIAAKGYVPQRRKRGFTPGENSVYFILGRPGMPFYSIGDVMVPFSSDTTRYVIVSEGKTDLEALRAHVAKIPALTLSRLQGDPGRPEWYRNFVVADVSIGGTGAVRNSVVADLARHLREHRNEGSLALLINEHPRGANMFEGEISLIFPTLMDAAALARFAATYELVFVRSSPPFTHFAMKTPSHHFAGLIEMIKIQNPNIRDVTPLMRAPIEID